MAVSQSFPERHLSRCGHLDFSPFQLIVTKLRLNEIIVWCHAQWMLAIILLLLEKGNIMTKIKFYWRVFLWFIYTHPAISSQLSFLWPLIVGVITKAKPPLQHKHNWYVVYNLLVRGNIKWSFFSRWMTCRLLHLLEPVSQLITRTQFQSC